MCAPVLLRVGTDEQRRRFLPDIYQGNVFWCQGYSEPGSASDLASLRTAAVRDGDHYRVTGQKSWTTLAHYGDWIVCLVRTESGARRQEGISAGSCNPTCSTRKKWPRVKGSGSIRRWGTPPPTRSTTQQPYTQQTDPRLWSVA